MEFRVDFLKLLDYDISVKILMCLEDPSDLDHVSSVSRFWRDFVIDNGLWKQLCLRMFPSLHRVDRVIEPGCDSKKVSEVGSSKLPERETLEREHKVYSFLAHGCMSFPYRDCIAGAVSASSTDNYPEESILNTMHPGDDAGWSASYWSSKGQSNPAVPETLVYKLDADICVITEISIQPFKAYFQPGLPIYSAKSVRFQMGHPKTPMDDPMGEPFDNWADGKFIWTYTSPEFPMAQENCLQSFTLPEPVLCIGGILQIELLGRVQTQETDGLFYICVAHVQVKGRPLSPAFGVEMLEPSGRFVLKTQSYTRPSFPADAPSSAPADQIVNILGGGGVIEEYNWNSEDDEEGEMDDELEGGGVIEEYNWNLEDEMDDELAF